MPEIRKYHFLLLFLLLLFTSHAQEIRSSRHYSINDGLPQSRIRQIYQDRQGSIWLGTLAGLVKFDGYDFHNYKVLSSGYPNIAKSNRVDRVWNDNFGRFWVLSISDAYCFNPIDESYWSFNTLKDSSDVTLDVDNIIANRSGKVWLIGEIYGATCILDSMFNYANFLGKNTSNPLKIHMVYEDRKNNSWFLTENGLGFLSVDNPTEVTFPIRNDNAGEENNNGFYTAYQNSKYIWFGSDNGKVWRYSKSSRTFMEQKINTDSKIKRIHSLGGNRLIFISDSDGMFIYEQTTNGYTQVSAQTMPEITNNSLSILHIEKPDIIWFSCKQKGVFKYNCTTHALKKYTSTLANYEELNEAGSFIIKDEEQQLWIQPKGGGFSYYNREKDRLEPLLLEQGDSYQKLPSAIYNSLLDKQGNLWFSNKAKGLNKISLKNSQFELVQSFSKPKNNITNSIRAIYQDKSGFVWMATKEKRLLLYTKKLELIGELASSGKFENKDWPANIYCITEDAEQNIWIGTRGSGIYILSPRKNKRGYNVKQYVNTPSDPYSLSNNNVYSIIQDRFKNIWIATLGGGVNLIQNPHIESLYFTNANNDLTQFPMELCSRVRDIKENSNGIIYAATTNGLVVWKNNFTSANTISFTTYNQIKTNDQDLIISDIMDMQLLQNNHLYLATQGSGLVKIDSFDTQGFPAHLHPFGMKSGLPSEGILNLQEDASNMLWLSTENELIRYNPKLETFEKFNEIDQVFSGNFFSESTSAQLSSGKMIFGTLNGIMAFDPLKIESNNYTPHLLLSDFKINSIDKNGIQKDSIMKAIDTVSHITLLHNQNFFNIHFSALDYNNTRNILYQYQLEGLEKGWNFTKKQRTARYTNIPSGTYTFRVKSTNGDGVWADNERTIQLTIKPSFWKTPLAYLLYTLAFIVLFVLVLRYILVVYKLKSDIKLQKRMSDIKLKFFTDISHEIRTPLTMITAPVEYMINDPRTPLDSKKQLSFISQSTNRLLKLVNQILDFQRVHEKTLTVMEINLAQFTKKICLDFTEMAGDNKIDFKFDELDNSSEIWVNPDDLEKVLMNLLGNAMKYNKAGNCVEVSVVSNEKTTKLQVKDNGAGIPKEQQKELFTRFATFNDEASNPSTGIGLAIVKEVSDKHAARLTLESDEGKGSCFTVEFRNGFEHFDSFVEIVQPTDKEQDQAKESNSETAPNTPPKQKKKSTSKKFTILIVEDDEKLRNFIKTILESDYIVCEAVDGKEGYNKAIAVSPDFIVSDVMMPKKNGIDLLKALRNNISTSHIPIILLTAKTNIESKLEGLNYGADDYITKPFSVSYFKARIQNLIKQRKLLQAIYSSGAENKEIVKARPNFLSKTDERFMEKVVELMHLNLERGDFTIEELSTLVGMSRTTLFNKLKSLTGMSPIEFLRDIRLKTAAKMILEKDMLIKEICYLIGFSDLKYFGTCFKTKYGVTPMQYRLKSRETNSDTSVHD